MGIVFPKEKIIQTYTMSDSLTLNLGTMSLQDKEKTITT